MSMTRKLRLLGGQTRRTQERWGLDFSAMGLHHWQRRWTRARRSALMADHAPFAKLVKEFENVAGTQSF